jgi:hypothetical protein
VSKADLKLDWCSHEAAKYAVEHWHYSRCMPNGKLVKIGVWENGVFVGAVIFGHGATQHLGKPYGLTQFQCCELVRIALTRHESPVTRIMAVAVRMLTRAMTGLRLIVSFADPGEGHHGGVYQGGNWIYAGQSTACKFYKDPRGKVWHPRRASKSPNAQKHLVTSGWQEVHKLGKHRYLMPLDDEMRKQIEPLRKPYPKRAGSADSGTPCVQHGRGGAVPTPALIGVET